MSKLGVAMATKMGRTGLVLSKYKPEIFIGVGLIAGVGAIVEACHATLKVDDILDEHKSKMAKVENLWARVNSNDDEESLEDYSEKDYKSDKKKTFVQTGLAFAKTYGPAAGLEVASVTCVLVGFGVLRTRNAAVMAAYKAVDEAFKQYRGRVVEEYGSDKDYEFKHNFRATEVVETVVDEDGKKTKVKKTAFTAPDGTTYSEYAKFFDESNPVWSNKDDLNFLYIHAQQRQMNELLRSRGHVFLNEVYDALMIDRTKAGQVVGWIWNGDGQDGIDFGLFDGEKVRNRAFVNGHEKSILLDFNVDGMIYDKI